MATAKVGKARLNSVAKRAVALNLTMPELCEKAGIGRVTWWRWEKAGEAPVRTFRKLEECLDELEGAQADG